jgi:hypothetical protein
MSDIDISVLDPVLVLLPAYGRSYETEAEVLSDWSDGKDFKVIRGPYCSIRDTELIGKDGFEAIYIIYREGVFPAVIPLSEKATQFFGAMKDNNKYVVH